MDHTSFTHEEAAALPAVSDHAAVSRYDAYPRPIRPYLRQADANLNLRLSMTKSGMFILLDLLSRTSINNPEQPIKVRVDRTAEFLGVSEKTVQRTINLMIENSLIKPADHHDGRNRWGRFSHREFIVMDTLRHIAGLPTSTNHGTKMSDGEWVTTEETVDNQSISPKMSDGYIKNKNIKEDIKEASFENTQNLKSRSQETEVKKSTRQLPKDLVELQDHLGLLKAGICSLMSLAKQHGQRLQDIWRAKKSALLNAGVREGRAFAYLKKLITSGEDFAFVAQQQSIKKALPSSNASQPKQDVRHFWNKKFMAPGGFLVKVYENCAEVVISAVESRWVASDRMDEVYGDIASGRLALVVE